MTVSSALPTADAVPTDAVPTDLLTGASGLLGRRLHPVRLLSARPDRCGGDPVMVAVLRADDDGSGPVGTGEVVVKSGPAPLVGTGARAQRLGHLAAAAVGAVADPAARLCDLAVPAVLAEDGAGLVVMEQAEGRRVTDLVEAGDLAGLRRAGTALAGLHTPELLLRLPVRDLAGHFADLVQPQPEALAEPVGPTLGRRAAGLKADLLAVSREQPLPVRLVHRDVHGRQVLVGPSRVWLLDWDLSAAGDPALDLGNLVGTMRARHPAALAEPAVRAVLDGYAVLDSTAALDRLAVHEAFTYLRLACKRARLQGRDAARQVEELLARGRRTLDAAP